MRGGYKTAREMGWIEEGDILEMRKEWWKGCEYEKGSK